jgi:hypothetical protein
MNAPERILPVLEPPGGGWKRLIARRNQPSQWAPSWPALAAGSAATVVVIALLSGRSDLEMPLSGARLIGERSQGTGLRALDEARARRLPSDDPNVLLYWIEPAPAVAPERTP